MTLEEKYELSCYEELQRLEGTGNITLVLNRETGQICVKKRLSLYNETIYKRIKALEKISAVSGIPEIYFCAKDEESLYIIEEYIQGQTLEGLLEREGVLSEEFVGEIVLSLCDILMPLHNLEPAIVHRDIKPSNLILDRKGKLYLIDFNAAKEYHINQKEDTILIGTKEYAAPEQYGFGSSSPRTDIYAIGILMNVLLTGDYPKQKKYTGKYSSVIEFCTKLKPEERYCNVMSLKRAMQGVVSKNMQEVKKENFLLKSHYHCPFLPVGFRTGTIWKMAIAAFGYAFLLWGAFATDVENKGEVVHGPWKWVVNFFLFLYFCGAIAFFGNYLNIREKFPTSKHPVLYWFVSIAWFSMISVFAFVLLSIIFVILENTGNL